MGHGIEMEVCQGTGSGVGVREKMVHKVHGRVCRWAQSPGGGWVGQSGCACMRKSWNGGNRVWWVPRGYPIGKLEPLGLISGEKVLQDGWQGWTDMSKCGNVARFGMCVCTHAWSARGRWEVVVGT